MMPGQESFLGVSSMKDVIVQLADDTIVVTMPQTRYRVSFYKAADRLGLLRSDFATDDGHAAASLAEFLTAAWRSATDKARELGWIV
jgi:hypothetical protein